MPSSRSTVDRVPWLSRSLSRAHRKRRSRGSKNLPGVRVPRFESLENRLLLATVMLQPSKDNTLIESPSNNSNARGELFAGRVGGNQSFSLRRAVMAFDFSTIPAGSTVTAASLDLSVSRSRGGSANMTLQRLTADWGEGTSSGAGQGSPATTNDATWTQRFFPSTAWTAPGGDFVSTASATTLVTGLGSFNWSAAGMVTDVQGWLDAPASNFGWILRGDETGVDRTVKRINSVQAGGTPPQLTVTFTEPAVNLSVSIAADSISEAAGAGATTATVTRSGSTASALVVTLGSNDATEATVPASVTIAAGQATSPSFNIDAVDDNLVDGTQTVTITASSAGVNDGTDTVDVTDDDVAALTMSIAAASFSEAAGAGATTATVSRNTSTASAQVVNLTSSDATEATVQSSVTIAAGQTTSPPFNIDAIDDAIVDGTQTVTITGSAAGFANGTDVVDVLDDDQNTITLTIAADSISEAAGAGATTATVSRNTDTSGALSITLVSFDVTEVTVQSSVTIAAGQATSAPFNLDAVDDNIVDGTQTTTISAFATGFVSGLDTVDVTDDDVAATVTGHVINGGQANRSGVDRLLLQFSAPVTVGTASSVKVWNHTAGSALDISAATLLNDGTAAVTLDLSAVTFPEGFYTAKLPASLGLAATHAFVFHVLPSDSTGDALVGFGDFGELAAAFNTVSGPRYGPGDFDGDGNVGFGDFGILAANFNKVLTPLDMDFGDALETGTSFPVTLPNGARHVLGSGLLLGATVDPEPDGQPGVAATGDGADEDGVAFGTLLAGSSAPITVTAVVPSTAVLNAWIDFNRDNDWDDPGEQIFVDRPVTNGTNNLTAAIPAGALAGPAYTRFRITSCEGHSYAGLAPDGEVEDYRVTLVSSFARQSRSIPPALVDAWAADSIHGSDDRVTDKSNVSPVGNSSGTNVVDLAVEQVAVHLPLVEQPSLSAAPPEDDLLDQVFEDAGDLLAGDAL